MFLCIYIFGSDLGHNKIGRILKVSFRDLANVATLWVFLQTVLLFFVIITKPRIMRLRFSSIKFLLTCILT